MKELTKDLIVEIKDTIRGFADRMKNEMKISKESTADLVAIKLKSFLSPLSISYEKKPRLVNPTWVVQPLLLKNK